jgi:hypothetical protein
MKISKPLQIVVLSTIALGIQFTGRAQGNLVNLYENWTIGSVTSIGGDGPIGIPSSVDITSSTSAILHPGWANNAISIQYNQFGAIAPVLSGNLDTTSGTTYEITFTINSESAALISPNMSMSFGNFAIDYFPVPALGLGAPFNAAPLNIEFTAMAASPITFISFTEYPCDVVSDFYNSIYLSNLSVVAVPQVIPVPEVSTASLLGLGGCAWLLAPFGRRSFGMRKSEDGDQRTDD